MLKCLRLTAVVSTVVFAACSDSPSPLGTDPLQSLQVAAGGYTVQALPIPGTALYGEANDINDAGVMAGWHTTGNIWSAVMWNAAGTQMTDLGKLPGFQSALAKGINAAGTIVGYVVTSGFGASRAFTWTAATGMQPLPGLGGGGGIAYAINDGGTSVGWSSTPSQAIHATKWLPNGTIVDINPTGAGYSEARSINELGDIVGVAVILPKREHAYLWRHDGVQIDLGTLGGARSWADNVNNNLVIVGFSTRPAPLAEIAFGWTASTGMRPLSKWGPSSEALGLSDLNRAVGKQTVNNGVLGLTQIRNAASIDVLPDLAPAKGFPFSASTNVNRCGTAVGSSVSPNPTNGNSVPVVWRKATCD